MLVDFNEAAVIKYQNDRLDEGTAPRTINEEVGFLLRILYALPMVLRTFSLSIFTFAQPQQSKDVARLFRLL
jgi:hypothetical protein